MPKDKLRKRLSKIKLIVSDVDGTIANNNNEIGEETRELVYKLSAKDVKITFATQRIHSSVVDFAKDLNIKIPIISINGALIKDLDNNIISKSVVSPKIVRKALDFAEKYFVRIALVHEDEIIYTESNSVLKDFMYRLGADYRIVESYDNYIDNILEIIMMGNEKSTVRYIQNKINFPMKFFHTAKYFRSSSKLGVYHLEVRKSGTSKKTGIQKLVNYLGYHKDEVAVIGDWFNDRVLFEYGGFNVALQNAVAELKMNADYVTEKTNDEDGVAEFLKMVYDSK